MKDTSLEVRDIYSAGFRRKSFQERFLLGLQMMEDGRRMVETSIKQHHSQLSAKETKALIFKRMYRDCFSTEELETIAKSLL